MPLHLVELSSHIESSLSLFPLFPFPRPKGAFQILCSSAWTTFVLFAPNYARRRALLAESSSRHRLQHLLDDLARRRI
jgi:hypothetical protein